MLLETIKRHDGTKLIKTISIDMLRATGKKVTQVHSVPALMILPEKHIIFGKDVFDYLLLPGTGKLLKELESPKTTSEKPTSEPSAFTMASGFSDNFAMLEEDSSLENGLQDRTYNWATLEKFDDAGVTINSLSDPQETRAKREEIDLSTLRAQRELDLRENDLNTNQLPPATTTR
jgi:hypothetical protein